MSLPPVIENHIICETTENLDQFPIANIHDLASASKWEHYINKELRRLHLRNYFGYSVKVARRTGTQIIHSHFGNTGWRDSGVAQKARLKQIVTFYGHEVNFPNKAPKWKGRYRELFGRADLFLCEGRHMRECIIGLGCPAEKVLVQGYWPRNAMSKGWWNIFYGRSTTRKNGN